MTIQRSTPQQTATPSVGALQQAGTLQRQANRPSRFNITNIDKLKMNARVINRQIRLELLETDNNRQFMFQGERKAASEIVHFLEQEVKKEQFSSQRQGILNLEPESSPDEHRQIYTAMKVLIHQAAGIRPPSKPAQFPRPLAYFSMMGLGAILGGGAVILTTGILGLAVLAASVGAFFGALFVRGQGSKRFKLDGPVVELPDYSLNNRHIPINDPSGLGLQLNLQHMHEIRDQQNASFMASQNPVQWT